MQREDVMEGPWPKVPLKKLIKRVKRRETVEPHKTYELLGAHWYAKGLYSKDVKPGTQIRAKYLYRIEENDFVYNRLFAWKGSFAIATAENDSCYVSNEFPCFHVDTAQLDRQYLWFYFSRASTWNEALGLSYGATPTSRNRLKEANLLSLHIPLPSLAEQRRIVARIEALAAKVEVARALREEATSKSSSLLNATLFRTFEDLDKQVKSVGELADEEICEVIPGRHILSKNYNENGLGEPYITGPADFGDKLPLVTKWTTVPKVFAEPGDILLTVKGAGVGKLNCAPDFSLCIGRQVMALRPNNVFLLRDYLYYFLMNSYDYFQDVARSTTVPGLKREHIWDLEFPLPPLSEQRRIVAHLDALQAKLGAVQAHQAATQARLDALLPSILDRAFRGEL